jgi:hypothetical protein
MINRFSVVTGGRITERPIAFSLVHRRRRVDVELPDVVAIEAHEDITFVLPDGELKSFRAPRVAVTLAPRGQLQIQRLTTAKVGEVMKILVCNEVVSRPRIREPLGQYPTFNITANDFADAEALAVKMRRGWVRPVLRVVGGVAT